MADLSTTKVYGDLTATNNIKGYTITNLSDVSVVYENRTITAGTGLTGGGALSNNITIGISAPVSIANGGTGSTTSPTQYGVIYASTTSTYGSTAAGATGQYLKATTSAAPAFASIADGELPPALTGKTYNALSLTAATTGFTIAGGTTSKTLTVSGDATVSGTNTGDQTNISGNAATATKLATARNIFGVSFDGSASISYGTTAGFAKFDSSGNFTTTDTNTYSLSGHTHNYAGSASAGGAANSVANSFAIKFDTGTTESTDLYTFNGSAAKTIDIKAGSNISLTKAAGSVTIANTYSYTLPVATASTLGGVKPDGTTITNTSGAISVTYGTSATSACVGNDSRLSNARTPTAHNFIDTTGHPASGLTTGHFLKALSATTYGFAAHGLTYSDIGAPSTSGTNASGTWGISISGNAATSTKTITTVAAGSTAELVYATMADNDFFRILVGGASNSGYAEIATADDGTEPIYVRQYTGTFATLTRTATLLDASGNTTFPGNLTSGKITIRDDSLENWSTDSDTTGVAVNYYGYSGGTTRFRDFTVYDGKGSAIVFTDGSAGNVGINNTTPQEKLQVDGNIRIDDASGNDGFKLSFDNASKTLNFVYVGA